MTHRAVFDTNVLVSALIRAGRSRELWNNVLEGKIELIISQDSLQEFDEVISRSKFRRYVKHSTLIKFARFFLSARLTQVRFLTDIITEDAEDNATLEAGFSGRWST